MAKVNWNPGSMISPVPAVMVSVGNKPSNYNIITVAWTGTVCSKPPMCYISVRKNRHSHAILMDTKEFVINLTTEDLAYATDWCGVRSGEKFRKFEEMKLTPGKASVVNAPIIMESPICIECKVVSVSELGVHDMFLAEVVNVIVDDKYLDPETDAFKLDLANPICYMHGAYYKVGDKIGKFGYSVEKKKKKK